MAPTKNVPKCPGTRVDVLDPCVEVPVPTGARDTSRTAFQSENFSGSFFSPPCPRTGRGWMDVGLLHSLSKKKCLSQSVHTPGGDRLNPWGEAPVPSDARDAPVSNGSGSFYFSRWSFRADGSVDENAWLAGLQSKILPDQQKKNRTDSRTLTCWHRCVGASSPRRTSTVPH